MSDRKKILVTYVGDMLSLEKHIVSATERQLKEESWAGSSAKSLVSRIQQTCKSHVKTLEERLETLEPGVMTNLKEGLSSALGMAAGLIDQLRSQEASKMLRDDYTALNLAAVSYTMLHTTGLALRESPVAELALRHLRDLTGLIVEINERIPEVVVADLQDDVESIHAGAASEARKNTQRVWESGSKKQPTTTP